MGEEMKHPLMCVLNYWIACVNFILFVLIIVINYLIWHKIFNLLIQIILINYLFKSCKHAKKLA
jgi:hypothetical protein